MREKSSRDGKGRKLRNRRAERARFKNLHSRFWSSAAAALLPTTTQHTKRQARRMSGASIPPAKAAAVAVAKKKAMPSPSEIAALRAARAAKKEREAREAEERAKAGAVEEQANVGEDGKPLFVAREWAKVKGVDAKEGVRIISWK